MKLKRIRWLILTMAALAAIAAFRLLGQGELNRLRQENDLLREQLAEHARIAHQMDSLERTEIHRAESDQLRRLRSEVVRLRAEATKLREAALLDPDQAREEIASLLAQAEAERERAQLLHARTEAEKVSKELEGALSSFVDTLASFAREFNEGKLPGSFAELQATREVLAERGGTPGESRRFNAYSEVFSELFSENLSTTNSLTRTFTGHFEFIPRSARLSVSDAPALVLREREPRLLPDGEWARFYGLSTGAVELVILPDNRFDEWERAFETRGAP